MIGAALVVSGLTAGYSRRPVLRDLALPPLAAGTLTALVGPNAAGKTTLLRALAGLLPARGSVDLGGRNLLALPPRQQGTIVAYMPQALPQRISLSVVEATITALRASPTGIVPGADGTIDFHATAAAMLDRLGIGALAFAMLDELSGGQRQLASLAQAIVRAPAVLLLDEPTSALDPHHQIQVMRAVKDFAVERGIVALVVLHDLNLALRWADTVVLLAGGQVAAAGPPDLAITPAHIAEAYRITARVERCSAGRPFVISDDVLVPT